MTATRVLWECNSLIGYYLISALNVGFHELFFVEHFNYLLILYLGHKWKVLCLLLGHILHYLGLYLIQRSVLAHLEYELLRFAKQ